MGCREGMQASPLPLQPKHCLPLSSPLPPPFLHTRAKSRHSKIIPAPASAHNAAHPTSTFRARRGSTPSPGSLRHQTGGWIWAADRSAAPRTQRPRRGTHGRDSIGPRPCARSAPHRNGRIAADTPASIVQDTSVPTDNTQRYCNEKWLCLGNAAGNNAVASVRGADAWADRSPPCSLPRLAFQTL